MWKSIKDLILGTFAVLTAGFIVGVFTAAFLAPIIAAWKFVTSVLF